MRPRRASPGGRVDFLTRSGVSRRDFKNEVFTDPVLIDEDLSELLLAQAVEVVTRLDAGNPTLDDNLRGCRSAVF
jgi:hypothetical protein